MRSTSPRTTSAGGTAASGTCIILQPSGIAGQRIRSPGRAFVARLGHPASRRTANHDRLVADPAAPGLAPAHQP